MKLKDYKILKNIVRDAFNTLSYNTGTQKSYIEIVFNSIYDGKVYKPSKDLEQFLLSFKPKSFDKYYSTAENINSYDYIVTKLNDKQLKALKAFIDYISALKTKKYSEIKSYMLENNLTIAEYLKIKN